MSRQGSPEPASRSGALVAWTFGSRSAAEEVVAGLGELGSHGVLSWSTVAWPRGAAAPRIRPGDRADGADFWYLVLGIAYLVPLVVAASDAAGTALPTLEFLGVSHEFLNRLRDQLVPGAAQLLAVVSAETRPELETLLQQRGPVHQSSHPLAPHQLAGIVEVYLA